ncbi:MAG TPA: hypothetical protein VI875_04325 [Candidatus Norongarragalinales archaeon]|nr:hypothetical protein [Candidatus Norongarragalinales archaeon]
MNEEHCSAAALSAGQFVRDTFPQIAVSVVGQHLYAEISSRRLPARFEQAIRAHVAKWENGLAFNRPWDVGLTESKPTLPEDKRVDLTVFSEPFKKGVKRLLVHFHPQLK